MQIILSFLLAVKAGRFLPSQHPSQINEEKETEPSNPPPFPPLKAYELVENKRTNEQNTTVNSSQKEPTDTQNSKNTVLFFSSSSPLFLFMVSIIFVVFLLAYILVGDSGAVLPLPRRLSGTGRQLSNRLVSSAVIYYLSISQCGRKSRVRRGQRSDGEVSQREGYRRFGQESEEPQQRLENN